jgi:hypothetical protein
MAFVLADTGAASFLTERLRAGKDLTLALYVTDVTLADTLTTASFTEAVGGGYASKTLTGGSWTIGDDGAGIQQAAYAQQTWSFTGTLTTNLTVYGYYVYDAGGLLGAERLTTPIQPNASGATLRVTPIVKVSKGTPS